MIAKFFRVSVLLVFAGLGGCVLVPGSNIDPRAHAETESWFVSPDGTWFPGLRAGHRAELEPSINELIDIVPITSQVISVHRQQAAQRPRPPAAEPVELLQELQEYDYLISGGDILSITVYDHPELTIPAGSMRTAEESGNIVQNSGAIYYPYIGEVQVDGRTVDEVRSIITERLSEFITDPQVDVKVIAYRAKRAYITGQVRDPGPQPISNVPLTVLDAISRAGGLTAEANWHAVTLSRGGEEYRLSVHEMLNNGRLGQNMLLRHGDVLHVPDIANQKVFVLGELNNVTALNMGSIPMSLTQALTEAGGLNQTTSNARGIFVIRQAPEDSEKLATVYQLDVRNAIAFAVGNQFMLEPTDIVYVTTAPVTRWNRVISQIMPSVTALLTLDRLVF